MKVLFSLLVAIISLSIATTAPAAEKAKTRDYALY